MSKKTRPTSRSAGRLAAVQALYEIDMVGGNTDQVLREFIQERWIHIPVGEEGSETTKALKLDSGQFTELVRGVLDRTTELDEMINGALSDDWTTERLEVLIRCILRVAAYELLSVSDVSGKIVISEYVDVANAFFTGNEATLVNGVLNKLARVLRATEFEGQSDGKQPETP